MKLVHVAEVHFGKKPPTHLEELSKKHPKVGSLKDDELVLLISKKNNQLVFVWRDLLLRTNVNAAEADFRTCLRWTQLYLRKGVFNPYMLVDYAQRVGLRIDNLPTFEQHLDRLLKHAVKQTFGDRVAKQKEKKR